MGVRVEKSGFVTTVILDRVHARNAVDLATARALVAAFEEFNEDESAHVAVFFGDHGHFCAGADLKEVASGEHGPAERVPREGELAPMGPSRMMLSKPVIAAVAGYAVAGGLELALWCDMRIVEEDATFGVFCRRWGVPLIDGGTVRLPRIVGHGRAMDMILTGRPVGAEEALAMGLANRVVPRGQARAEAEKIAHQIAEFPQTCLRADRLSAYRQWDLPQEEALWNELRRGLSVIESGETVSGAGRFAKGEGRHGTFK